MNDRVVIGGVDYTNALSSGEVAELLDIDIRTVRAWVHQGRLACFRTPGGHRRFSRTQVEELMRGGRDSAYK